MEGITLHELLLYKESLHSCAIEGNKWAKEQLELYKTDMDAFISEYLRRRDIDDAD